MHLRSTLFLSYLLISTMVSSAQKINIACVGNSVTYGAGIKERLVNSYPAQLQELLGNSYLVKNFGYSGATMLKKGHKPYWTKKVFQESQNFAPNIVIIHLGLNDQGNNNWPAHKKEFVSDYLEMIKRYKNLPSKPKVIICKMTPTFSGHHWFEEGMRENFKEIQQKIEEIAQKAGVQLINLHEPLYRYPEYFPDNLHPTKKGASIIAQKIYAAISGNFGGLSLPKFYGENMVFQRNEPIVITGSANANDTITIRLNNKKSVVSVSDNGLWKVELPPMKAGGPYFLKITSLFSENISFQKVYIGEVWLASGQSNMDFTVSQMQSAPTVLTDSLNPKVFVLSMDPKVLGAHKFSKKEHALCNAKDFINYSGWKKATSNAIQNFSAVAYAFAYKLQKNLNVPVGIICNAVGGSPTQSWISRERMEQQHETISLLNDTWLHPLVDTWVTQQKKKNFGNLKQLKGRHPYDPTFLFDTAIYPLINFNFKGVIWYQGESNTEHPNLHARLFNTLINDWRTHFKKPTLPFYYTQLSSIDRAYWGIFRNQQRLSLSIQHTGMAVSLDVGHQSNVHPPKKWIIGERLAKIALAKSYAYPIGFSGPLLDYVTINKETLEVHFKHNKGLQTSGGHKVIDLFIAGEDKQFVAASSRIKNNVLIVWSPNIKNPRYVKYGFTPFTKGNLINLNKLPASTFSNLHN